MKFSGPDEKHREKTEQCFYAKLNEVAIEFFCSSDKSARAREHECERLQCVLLCMYVYDQIHICMD